MKRTLLSLIALAISLFSDAQSLQKDSGFVSVPHDGKIYYEAYGEGEPFILLHGHTLDRRMWRPQIEAFAKKYRVITPDMRGYGRSSRQYEGLNTTHADDLVAFMDSLKITKAHILGLSMGGFISADMVCMYPERMLSCVMASGSLRSRKGPSEPMDSLEAAESSAAIQKVLNQGIDNWRKEWIEQLVKGGGSNAENIRKDLTQMIYDWDAWQLVHHELRIFYAREALPILQKKCPSVPCLFLSGENEHKKRPGMMKYLPNSDFQVLPDCGHMNNMEQPELFNKAILNFLDKSKTYK